jgi:hypothetical protein
MARAKLKSIVGSDEANELVKKVVEQPHIVETPFFLIDHQTLY